MTHTTAAARRGVGQVADRVQCYSQAEDSGTGTGRWKVQYYGRDLGPGPTAKTGAIRRTVPDRGRLGSRRVDVICILEVLSTT